MSSEESRNAVCTPAPNGAENKRRKARIKCRKRDFIDFKFLTEL
jgi:hypothetical protein